MSFETNLCLLLSQVIPGASRPDHPNLELTTEEFRSFSQFCGKNRIMPLLVRAVSDGLIKVSAESAQLCVDEALGVMAVAVRIESIALRTLEVLDQYEIEARVIKGVATSHLDYLDPSLRQFGDADILIPPEQFGEALSHLGKVGIFPKFPLRGGQWRIQHSVPLDVDGFEIDLHHRLLHQSAGHLSAKLDLFSSFDELTIGNQVVKALPRPVRLIQAAAQNVLSDPEDSMISSDVDVLLLEGAIDEAYEVANSVGLGWVLDLGVARAHNIADLSEHRPMATRSIVSHLMMNAYSGPRPSPARLALLEAFVAPVSFTSHNLWSAFSPGEDYLVMRGRSRGQQLRRQVARIRSR